MIDTDSRFLYMGTLQEVGDHFLRLTGVDVHDDSESRATKEVYVMEGAKLGLKKNRDAVLVRLERVVSVSLLEDVIVY